MAFPPDTKKHRPGDNQNECSAMDNEICGLDALASAAVLGESMVELVGLGEKSAGPTTKHPRHRAGCSCIVCIQPPSGKGKHRPTCTCNACMTVKRRFKTLMLRKKKQRQQYEYKQQADVAAAGFKTIHGGLKSPKPTDEVSLSKKSEERNAASSIQKGEDMQAAAAATETDCNNGQIDLNCDPGSEGMEGPDDEAHARADNIINCLSTSGTLLPTIDDYPTITATSRHFDQLLQEQAPDCQSSNLLSICQVEDAAAENEKHHAPPNEEAVASLAEKGEKTDDDGHDEVVDGNPDAHPS